MYRSRRRRAIIAAAMLALAGFAGRAIAAGNDLLAETVEFTGAVLFLETGVPGLVIGAVRGGETAVSGFGEFQPGSGQAPDVPVYRETPLPEEFRTPPGSPAEGEEA